MEVVLLFSPDRMVTLCPKLTQEIFTSTTVLHTMEDQRQDTTHNNIRLPRLAPRHVLQLIQEGPRLVPSFVPDISGCNLGRLEVDTQSGEVPS